MRLLLIATAATFVFSAAIAAPPAATGSGTMMGSGNMMGTGTMMGSAMTATSGTMMIHHKVADYAKWRVAYDADMPSRAAAGLTSCHVQRSMDDANDVVISCNMADATKARNFAASKALEDKMAKAGVVGKPEFLYLSTPK
jgi:hypothetical protein